MAERTPGPWRAKGRTIMNADGVKIATVTVHSGGKNFKPDEVAEANAAFIVDACNRADLVEPLVEALRKCALVCAGETTTRHGLVDALESARAALQAYEAGQ